MTLVTLDPDGTVDFGLAVIVERSTGVTYSHQCAGALTAVRSVEGFLIPLGSPAQAKPVYDWFRKTFRGNCHVTESFNPWNPGNIKELKRLVAQIPCWYTNESENDIRWFLELADSRMDECTEAWIPVLTPYGPGILIFRNSD